MPTFALRRESLDTTQSLKLPAPGMATEAHLEALPGQVTGQLVSGTLYAQARPAYPHQRTLTRLSVALGQRFDREPGGPLGPGGWWLMHAPELHFGADVVSPDIVGWRRERLVALPKVPWLEFPPDWVCEITSPATRALDRGPKLALYHRVGVGHVWLVDPIERYLQALRWHAEGWFLAATHFEDEVIGIEPFQAEPLTLADWWL